jgi:hypothetical protein
MEGKRRRKPVGSVSKPQLQMPGFRPNAGRRNRAPRAPVATAELPFEQPGAGPETQIDRTPDRLTDAPLSPETIAAAAALDAPPAADPAAPGAPPGANPAAPIGPTIEECRAECRVWLDTLDTLAGQLLADRAPASVAAFHQREIRHNIADALGDTMHHYGLSGLDVASHPLARLAVAMLPLAVSAFSDWRRHRDQAAAAVAEAPPPATPIRSPVGEAMAPASTLHNRL